MQQDTILANFSLPTKGTKRSIGNINASNLGFMLAELYSKWRKVMLIIVANNEQAINLDYELRCFLPAPTHMLFPDWETLPYDNFTPHQDLISTRLQILYQLPTSNSTIVIANINTILHKLCTKQFIFQHSLCLQVGSEFAYHKWQLLLTELGYRATSQVEAHGEFCYRGSIIDLFPLGSPVPYRIDLCDDIIDSIRSFDPDTQLSHTTVTAINILPAREFPTDHVALQNFRAKFREHFTHNPQQYALYQDVKHNILTPGIEYYLSLFFDNNLASIFDFLDPDRSLIVTYGDLAASATAFWQEINDRYITHKNHPSTPAMPPESIFWQYAAIMQQINNYAHIKLTADPITRSGDINATLTPLPALNFNAEHKNLCQNLQNFVTSTTHKILFTAESEGRAAKLCEILATAHIKPTRISDWPAMLKPDSPQFAIITATLNYSLIIAEYSLAVITENDLYNHKVMQRRRRAQPTTNVENVIRDLIELKPGQAVVHTEHGIGRYLGLECLTIAGIATEFVVISYANDAKLYVPVNNLHLISRYSGHDAEHTPLHVLGNAKWQKSKAAAQQQVRDVAAELLKIYAVRATQQAPSLGIPNEYQNFVEGFPFEETADQEQAITQVITDLTSTTPMDRLVCGDVGFGKTEVALRAAFIAANNSLQTIILVPTTLLAEQHYQTFSDRMHNWPIKIELLSRFRTTKDKNKVINDTNAGKIDILIGTHQVLQKTLHYPKLGLLIIDEEHRFGVQQKEQIKALKHNVHTLTLTATPIPRTLNMAFAGLRDLSIIASPPAKRLAIKTFVREYDPELIREAVWRELLRGGQIYYVHNDVATITHTAERLQNLLPDAKIAIAHGQLPERELEIIMRDFYQRRYNILVCTTIIETGIDIPSANTIIIDRADKFGLSQLHQLRGRVGRSHHQAYAYLFTPPHTSITSDAKKRLEAIASLEELGAGFTLANHDLEIRGSGELLGAEQSGQISEIGYSLYMEYLQKAVHELKTTGTVDTAQFDAYGAELDLNIPALIPHEYVPDVQLRLMLYKRIANCRNPEQLTDLEVEFIDRFGALPPFTKHLFKLQALKMQCNMIGIKKIDANATTGKILFYAKNKVNHKNLVNNLQQQAQHYKLLTGNVLQFKFTMSEYQQRLECVEKIIVWLMQ